MLQPNALKVTMLFPIFANDGSPFPVQTWSWWFDSILAIGAYHEFFTRGAWEGRTEYHRCVTMVLEKPKQLEAVQAFLREAREKFGQQVMYFEAVPIYFELI